MRIIAGILIAAALSAMAPAHAGRETRNIEVFKTRTCACCVAWIARLEEAGFVAEARDLPMADLAIMKRERGVPADLVGCHTAMSWRGTFHQQTSNVWSTQARTRSAWQCPECLSARPEWSMARSATPSK